MWLTTLGGGGGSELGTYGPFLSEKHAQAELKKAAQIACEAYEKAATGKVSDQFIDMKTNETRKWDKSDEN